ncbi:MAG: response regulator transcription factor [Anaerolineae bacterium]|nr:response regulator transcription factor [Anaerolineae bacterium]MCA9895302.1 response regulator transcription factor [Anaerolineae bacterium]MCB9460613.1 response regulator transcription factor [Anaerolineaceae bacterium]
MTINVLIVDDHAVVRAGIRMLIESDPDLKIVGECENGQEAVDQVEALQPDVVLMDVTMPVMDGVEATRLIKSADGSPSVLAMTIHEGPDYFFQMLQAGASGYVPKRAAPDDLLRAIHVVAEGNVFLEPQVAKELVSDYLIRVQQGGEKESYDGLTEREQEVLKLIAEDETNQGIANVLGISVKTVERHRENMMSKLNLHSRIELVKYAIRKGLISLED